ncbi:MAG: hypothetical protein AAB492_01290 [Patescibacteria group bacterium]
MAEVKVKASELSNEQLFREVGKKASALLKRSDIVNDPADRDFNKSNVGFDRTLLEEGDQRLNKFPGSLTDETKMTGAQRVEAISVKYHEKDRVRLQRIAKRKK